MPEQPSHKYSDQDTTELVNKGYIIQGIQAQDLATFVQTNFPGFSLKQFLTEAEDIMNPNGSISLTRYIRISGTDLTVGFINNYTNVNDALYFERKFYKENGKLIVSHEYLIMPENERGKNTAKKVISKSLIHYKEMKADYVVVLAGLSRGAYVWARFGFTAIDKNEMQKILQIAQNTLNASQFTVVKLIFDNYYNNTPNGDEFPIKLWADLPFMKPLLMDPQCYWYGRLDLKNSEQLRKLGEYVKSR